MKTMDLCCGIGGIRRGFELAGGFENVLSAEKVLSGKGCGNSKTTRMLAQKQPYIQRVRNSSLVERSCAENVPGLKHDTEAEEPKGW